MTSGWRPLPHSQFSLKESQVTLVMIELLAESTVPRVRHKDFLASSYPVEFILANGSGFSCRRGFPPPKTSPYFILMMFCNGEGGEYDETSLCPLGLSFGTTLQDEFPWRCPRATEDSTRLIS